MRVGRASSRARWLDRLTDALLPRAAGLDAEACTRRARLLLVVLLVCSANLLFTAAMQTMLGHRALAAAMLGLLAVPVGFGAALRSGLDLRVLCHGAVGAIYLATFDVTLAPDGQMAGGRFFMVLVPAVAMLLVDRRAGLAWAGVTVATLLASPTLSD